MARLVLDSVTVDFPIYGQRSLRSALVARRTGGTIQQDTGGRRRRITVRALDQVTLEIEHGDRLGLIGHNGAGKSTLLRVMAGVYEPVSGSIRIEGNLAPLFNINPGLDLDDTGYETIRTCGMFLGMSDEEIEQKTPDIVEFCELGEYLELPVRTYSTGMMTRLGFAIATAVDPEILLLDEGLGAGDARFAERAKRRVDSLVARSSILVLASHGDALIQSMCNKAVLLEGGRVVRYGGVEEVLDHYHYLTSAEAEGKR